MLGTVPVEADGSAHFTVPARKELFFQALDDDGLAVQSMRSATYLQPGERLVCQGCHEPRHRSPQMTTTVPLACDGILRNSNRTSMDIPTDEVVEAYPDGASSRYLEELAFQFGRYMLICSSRAGTLPPNLQGIWNLYKEPPWASQYLHDTNLQMAYSPAFSTNLSELFESYMAFFKAFVPRQRLYATQYVEQFNPRHLDPKGDNGWSGPFWANPYSVPGRSMVAGFGTGSWIALMFWDYYDFTRDESLLEKEVYPVLYDQANFVSRFVKNVNGVLLADPSSSPEQKIRDTVGTTFDQQMFYENHHNTLKAARILGRSDSRLATFETQLPLLDPIQVGNSGQIKEFRQEKAYGEIGDPNHRHSSMLLGLYPGQLINDRTPAWLDAAKVSLTERSHKTRIGWARAERIAMWARVHDGEEAYSYYRELLGENYMHNLFNDHRGGYLFQADANYGATGGVAEMLLQSQDYVVAPLSAMPASMVGRQLPGLAGTRQLRGLRPLVQWSCRPAEGAVQIGRDPGAEVPQRRPGCD